jgi:hypothetical protein
MKTLWDLFFTLFVEIWGLDFEFQAPPSCNPIPNCMVAREFKTGRVIRMTFDELRKSKNAPFNIGPDSLVVAYYAPAEMSCFIALGWEPPANLVDLYAEFRNATNGFGVKADLLSALTFFNIPTMETKFKEEMRLLSMRGSPFSADEMSMLIDYCEQDVTPLEPLMKALPAFHDTPVFPLFRGRYTYSVAEIEFNGIPMDVKLLEKFKMNFDQLKLRLIAEVDSQYNVFDGLTFKTSKFEELIAREGIGWPRTPLGKPRTDSDTFRDMVKTYPRLRNLAELLAVLSQLKLNDLSVGPDGRARCMLSIFRSKTARNQPSNSKFPFGLAAWMRGFIKPEEDTALAYVDWSQQEFGEGAEFSGDEKMIEAYHSSDPYIAFAKQAGAVPPDATKASHPNERALFKQCLLAVQYGMGAETLALRIKRPVAEAKHLLWLHRQTYKKFWKWSDAVADTTVMRGYWDTVFGWRLHLTEEVNLRSIRNFPMQANGSEMLRVACIRLQEAGIKVCAPIHDAVLIEAPLEQIEKAVAVTQEIMAAASAEILGGTRLKSDAKIIRWPDRYSEDDGTELWDLSMKILKDIDEGR